MLCSIDSLARVGVGMKLRVNLSVNLFASTLLDHILICFQKVPDFHIVLQKHLVLLHELDSNTQVVCH
jgi:hypothetical protein